MGDLPVARGSRVRGRVLLADGKPLPPGTRLLVSREEAWDSRLVELGPDGRFAMAGLPAERYRLAVSVPGYRVSPANRSVDPDVPGSLLGTIDRDVDSLAIQLEPGQR